MDCMKIKAKEKVKTSENLTNHKIWFNGLKEFSSIKVQPPYDNTLLIHVADELKLTDKMGG